MARSLRLFAPLLLSSLSGLAQQASAGQAPNGSEQNLTLDVVVTDKAGTPVRGLLQKDFTLLDNKQPQGLTSFRAVDVAAGTSAPSIEIERSCHFRRPERISRMSITPGGEGCEARGRRADAHRLQGATIECGEESRESLVPGQRAP